MKNRGIVLMFLALSLVGFGIGYLFTNSTSYGLCVANETVTEASCINLYERVGDALFYGMGALAVVFLALLVFPKAFEAWKKFAIWFVPLAALLLAFYGDPVSGDLFSPYPEQVFQWVSSLYVVISYSLIGLSLRKKS